MSMHLEYHLTINGKKRVLEALEHTAEHLGMHLETEYI